jgi:hypothetical protein
MNALPAADIDRGLRAFRKTLARLDAQIAAEQRSCPPGTDGGTSA